MAYSKWKDVCNSSGDALTDRAPADWRPIQGTYLPIISCPSGGSNFELNNENLQKILLHPMVKDRKVVVISSSGESKKGKSFILNYILRYLVSKGSSDWLCSDSAPMVGFPWRGGKENTTLGVHMWSVPYLREIANGEQVAVLLMDTQGVFDYWYKLDHQALKIFGISSLISSMQLFNTSSDIKENDLEMLKTIVEYGRLCVEGNINKPFQSLYFLIKDWVFPFHYAYGGTGGAVLLDKRLQVQPSQNDDMQYIRCHIRTVYERITCFLLPHPGLSATVSPHFDGRLSDISDDYKAQLKVFIPSLLSPKNLYVKEIHGSKITGIALLEYVKSYWKIFKGNTFPDPDTILNATSEANNMSAISVAKCAYIKEINQVLENDTNYLSEEDFKREHDRCKIYAMRLFGSMSKMGTVNFCQRFMVKLKKELDILGEEMFCRSDSRLCSSNRTTPVVLAVCFVVLFAGSKLFKSFDAINIGMLLSLGCLATFALFIVWALGQFFGYSNVGLAQQLDGYTNVIARKVTDPIQSLLKDKENRLKFNKNI